MELNWSTFVFEIINFLVLVWILKRFLYQPVLDIINRRRSAIEAQLAEVKQQQTEAGALKARYERELGELDDKRRKAMDKLKHEIETVRQQQFQKLKTELAGEEEKTRVAKERQDMQVKRETEQRALHQGAEFASRLLAEAAGPELENRLIALLLEELQALPEEQVSTLANNGSSTERVLVTSAYPLTDSIRRQLEAALHRITGTAAQVQYKQDEKLLAGLNISIGSWLLALNVRDELRGFVELVNVEH